MWIRWSGDDVAGASLAPIRSSRRLHVLMPSDETTLTKIGAIAAGQSRTRLYVRRVSLYGDEGVLRLCVRGTPGAVRVTGPVKKGASIRAVSAGLPTLGRGC